MRRKKFSALVDGVRCEADPCPRCGELPTIDDVRLELQREQLRCRVCSGEIRPQSLDIRHDHGSIDSLDGRWVKGFGVFVRLSRAYSHEGQPWIHEGCRTQTDEQGVVIPDPRYLGDFDLEIEPDGSFAIPGDWADGDSSLLAIAGAVTGEECIRVYPASEWARMETNLRHYGRILQVPVYSLTALPSGRLMLPRPLLDAVGIRYRIHVSGACDWFELWSASAWTRAMSPVPGERAMWPDPEKLGRRGFLGGLLGLIAFSFLRRRGKTTDDHFEDPVPEVAVLGALLQRPALLSEVERVVEAWMFRGRRTSAVFRWMVDQRRRGCPHDLRAAVLAARSAGGPGAAQVLVNWLQEVPNCDSAVAYAECVRVQRPGVLAALERRRAIGHIWA